AVNGERFNVLDVVDSGGQDALVHRGHALFELLGIEAGVVPDGGDDRDVDIRKDVGGGAKDYQRGCEHDEQRQHDEGIRPVEGYTNNPHKANWVCRRAAGRADIFPDEIRDVQVSEI